MAPKKPSISVVVPVYNGESTIGSCLQSLLNQEWPRGFELIVIDDGSKDGSAEIVKSFKGARYFHQRNRGPACARNQGAKKARGELLVFVDDDCVAEPDFLKQIVAPFSDKCVAGVQGRYKNNQRELISRIIQLEIEERYEKMRKHKFIDHIGTYAAAYRRKEFLALGGFDESFPIASGEDIDFSFKLAKAGRKLVFRPSAVVWHVHPANLQRYLQVKFWRAFYRNRMYKNHADKMLNDSYTSQSIKFQLGFFYLFIGGAALSSLGLLHLNWLLLIFAGYLVTTLKFWRFCLSRDFEAGLAAPFILLLRTIWFGVGFAYGAYKELIA